MLLEVKTTIWRSTGGQSSKSTVLDSWVYFHRIFRSGNPYIEHEYCSDVTGGHNYYLKVQIRGQASKSTVLDFLVSFYRIFESGNSYMALEYCSDVTGGHNCHLEVIIGGQLEVNH